MNIPSYLYHGSTVAAIETLEPRLRYTPGDENNSPQGIYATDDPAYAAAHAFPWSSDEGVVLHYDSDGKKEDRTCVHLEVPSAIYERLNQPVYIYKVNSSSFSWVKEEVVGKTYRSLEAVKCIGCQRFPTVVDAVETFGGKVIRI